MVEEKLFVAPTQTGQRTQGTENLPWDMSSFKQQWPLTGRAANRPVWPCPLLRQNMLLSLQQLQQLTSELLNKCIRDMMLHGDNQSTIAPAKNQHTHGRTKHIDIKFHL